jgi:DNA-binding MarR family transcriptional regulator
MKRSHTGLGPALRRAWVGYQRRLDDEMAAAGFTDRRFPDGRVLRMCRDADATISSVGRELGITRQGAAKIVARLQARGYVAVTPSPTSAREKLVTITPRATEYLAAQRAAARRVERLVRRELGDDALTTVLRLSELLAPNDDERLRAYLTRKSGAED